MRRRRRDGGFGMIGSLAGLTVTVLFLALATQVMIGLYTTSMLRATLHDAASRAANEGAASPGELRRLAAEGEASLGRMGRRTTIDVTVADDDGDGAPDVVIGHARTSPPRVIPLSMGGMVGFESVSVGVRVRIERFR
jgi:hypothetical protein